MARQFSVMFYLFPIGIALAPTVLRTPSAQVTPSTSARAALSRAEILEARGALCKAVRDEYPKVAAGDEDLLSPIALALRYFPNREYRGADALGVAWGDYLMHFWNERDCASYSPAGQRFELPIGAIGQAMRASSNDTGS